MRADIIVFGQFDDKIEKAVDESSKSETDKAARSSSLK